MNPAAKLTTYAAILLASFGVGAAVGGVVGPLHVDDDRHSPAADSPTGDRSDHRSDHDGHRDPTVMDHR